MNGKKKNSQPSFPLELMISDEQKLKVQEMLDSTVQEEAPFFWETANCREFYVPVDGGEIRIFHIKPDKVESKRPIVFIPGWGGLKEEFHDYYKSLHDRTELYYVETREKNSSRLHSKNAKMDMSQKAKDIKEVIKYLELEDVDFVLHGTCWGSSIMLQGLLDGTLNSPTILTHDPMHTLWFPKWILRYIAPILPAFVVRLLKPFLKWMQLKGMEEEVQRQRAEVFIKHADIKKWRKTAIAVKDFELFGNISGIKEPVVVTNGTTDKVHDQIDYPKIAKELPNGRFIYMETDESQREKLIGLMGYEFSKITKEEGIPQSLMQFEKDLNRNKE